MPMSAAPTKRHDPTAGAPDLPVKPKEGESFADETAPTLEQLVKIEFLDDLLERFPLFCDFYHKHPLKSRESLRKDWREQYREHPEWDYGGRTEHMRKWVTSLRDAGLFNGGVLKGKPQFPSRFALGQRIRIRDKGEEWRHGIVKQLEPLRVRPEGDDVRCNWKDAHWDEVEPLPFELGEKVRCRDKGAGWQVGRVKGFDPLRVEVNGLGGAHTWDQVEVMPDLSEYPDVIVEKVDEQGLSCPISLEPIGVGDKVVELPCKCRFLRPALEEWFAKTPSCPLCRDDLCTAPEKAAVDPQQALPLESLALIVGLDDALGLNGATGYVRGYTGGRVIVYVPGHGAKAFEPHNLMLAPGAQMGGAPPTDETASQRSVVSLASQIDAPPVGSTVEVLGLTGPLSSLNGERGRVLGYKLDRVAVSFTGHGKKALRAQNCRVVAS